MKRILAMILMSILLLGTLTACGGQTTSEGDPSSAPSAPEETRQEDTAAPSDSKNILTAESKTTEPPSEAAEKKLKMTVNGQAVLITLYDIEFTAHNIVSGEKVGYCPTAVFYDEQPTGFRQSVRQRIRWVQGYL